VANVRRSAAVQQWTAGRNLASTVPSEAQNCLAPASGVSRKAVKGSGFRPFYKACLGTTARGRKAGRSAHMLHRRRRRACGRRGWHLDCPRRPRVLVPCGLHMHGRHTGACSGGTDWCQGVGGCALSQWQLSQICCPLVDSLNPGPASGRLPLPPAHPPGTHPPLARPPHSPLYAGHHCSGICRRGTVQAAQGVSVDGAASTVYRGGSGVCRGWQVR